jgi:hypothetical protein
LSELIHNLTHPSKELLNSKPPAIIERDPLRFWQMSCAVLRLLFFLNIVSSKTIAYWYLSF